MWKLTNGEFTELMQQYQRLIYTVCLQFVHEPHTAEDLTQDTFLSAYSAIDRCEPQYYKAWLVRVAANKCKDHLKSSWVRRVETLDFSGQRTGPVAFSRKDGELHFQADTALRPHGVMAYQLSAGPEEKNF